MVKNDINKRRMAIALVCLLFTAVMGLAVGCDEDSEGEVDSRFATAEEVTETWCVESLRRVAGFDATTLPDSMILNDVYQAEEAWTSILSRVAPDETPPIEIRVFIETFCDAEPPAPDNLSERLLCKMPNQERIATLLELTPSSEPGTCKSRNEDAFAWALEQLTPAEREAYEAEGWPVTFLKDAVVNLGGAWIGQTPNFELAEDGQSYEIVSPSLQTRFDPSDPDPETPEGVHYCKLVTPAQALYWVLHRGFKDDPGICEEVSEGCPIPNSTPVGSCIFLHHPTPAMPEQHFCEEYTGPSWTEADAAAKCAARTDGIYKPVSCAERPDETSEIDGDGEYKGACVIACGDLEYLWLAYSGTVGQTAPFCPEGFFLPNGEKFE